MCETLGHELDMDSFIKLSQHALNYVMYNRGN